MKFNLLVTICISLLLLISKAIPQSLEQIPDWFDRLPQDDLSLLSAKTVKISDDTMNNINVAIIDALLLTIMDIVKQQDLKLSILEKKFTEETSADNRRDTSTFDYHSVVSKQIVSGAFKSGLSFTGLEKYYEYHDSLAVSSQSQSSVSGKLKFISAIDTINFLGFVQEEINGVYNYWRSFKPEGITNIFMRKLITVLKENGIHIKSICINPEEQRLYILVSVFKNDMK